MEDTLNINELIGTLRGVGIQELEQPLNFFMPNGEKLSLVLSNISTQREIESLLAAEDFKGQHWLQRVKCEVLSRAITKINDIPIDGIADPFVQDPSDPSKTILIRTAFRNQFLSWGPEALQVAWRIYMVHCQNLEDKLLSDFPDAMVMTEYERKFYERTMEMVDEFNREMIQELSEVEEPKE